MHRLMLLTSRRTRHLLAVLESSEGWPIREQLHGHDAEGPGVHRGAHPHRVLASSDSTDNLGGGVRGAVPDWCVRTNSGSTAKVDERPPVLPRQPHDVGELEVAVDKAGRVQVHEPLRHVLENLHTE